MALRAPQKGPALAVAFKNAETMQYPFVCGCVISDMQKVYLAAPCVAAVKAAAFM
jgi:hypothetical protein